MGLSQRKLRIVMLVILFLATLAYLSVFTSVKDLLGNYLSSPPKWVNTWLRNPTCSPPCWENIEPGKTTIDLVPGLLSRVQEIGEINPPEIDRFSGRSFIRLNFAESRLSRGSVETKKDSNIIERLRLHPPANSLVMKDLIAAYGEPTQILVHGCKYNDMWRSCMVEVVYLPKGLLINLGIDVCKEKNEVKIKPTTSISEIYFIEPGEKSLISLLGDSVNPNWQIQNQWSSAVIWKGYTTYP